MEFSLIGALAAGFVATAVMAALMKMSARMGMTDMPPMELVIGSMLTGDLDRARRVGTVVHWFMMGTIGFGLGYAAVFTGVGSASALTGILLGAVHGVAVGLVFLPMMPAVHPRMGANPTFDGTVQVSNGTVELATPGLFGARWGGMTPVGLLMGHVVYGLVAALVYQAIV